jgi:hypothetical protein
MDIAQDLRKRFEFLHLLFKRTNGNPSAKANLENLGGELGWTLDYTLQVVSRLDEDNLISWPRENHIRLTPKGRQEVEAALAKPNAPTEHFPPWIINIIHADTITGNIQQGTSHSQQTANTPTNDLGPLVEWLRAVVDEMKQHSFDDAERQEVEADIATLNLQIASPKPKRGILVESFGTVWAFVQAHKTEFALGTSASLAASELQRLLPWLFGA